MLEAANEFEATRTMVDARLGRDERRREGVPTVSVLAGPANLAATLLGRWCERHGRPLVVLPAASPALEHVATAWVDRVSAGCDLAEIAAAWLIEQSPEDRRPSVASLRTRTPVELALFLEGTLPGSSTSGVEAVCKRLLIEAAEGSTRALNRVGLTARIDATLDAHPHPSAHVLKALAELVPVPLQPVLAFIGQETEHRPEAVFAFSVTARLVTELAIAQPRLSLVLAVGSVLFRAYQDQAPESRARALLRESVVHLPATVADGPRPAAQPGLVARSPELAPFFQDATRAIEAARASTGPEPIDRARSAAERFLYECLQRLPETAGLFRLNASLGFPFGPGRDIEADLAAESLRLVVEIDGHYHFQDLEAYRRDRRKDLELQKHGYLVVRVLAEDVVCRLEPVLDTILGAVAFRGRQDTNIKR